jgi:hypothetical protein
VTGARPGAVGSGWPQPGCCRPLDDESPRLAGVGGTRLAGVGGAAVLLHPTAALLPRPRCCAAQPRARTTSHHCRRTCRCPLRPHISIARPTVPPLASELPAERRRRTPLGMCACIQYKRRVVSFFRHGKYRCSTVSSQRRAQSFFVGKLQGIAGAIGFSRTNVCQE